MSNENDCKYPASRLVTLLLCELSCKKYPLPTTIQIRPEMWMNKLKKPGVFPVLDQFRALHKNNRLVLCKSCVAVQSCHNFFILAKLAPFDNRPDN